MTKNHLPNNKNGHSVVTSITKSEIFSGPLPPPTVLERYNQIVPGAAERIITMAENQSAHRIQLEKSVISSDIHNSKRGQLFGFIIAVLGITFSFILVIKGYQIVGTILGGATLISLVSVFVYGTTSRKNERKAKDEKMTKNLESPTGNIIEAEVEEK